MRGSSQSGRIFDSPIVPLNIVVREVRRPHMLMEKISQFADIENQTRRLYLRKNKDGKRHTWM